MFKGRIRTGTRGSKFATYPVSDHLNVALGHLLENAEENRVAIEEICFAITKHGGYFYSHIANLLVFYGFGCFVSEDNVCG